MNNSKFMKGGRPRKSKINKDDAFVQSGAQTSSAIPTSPSIMEH